MTPRNRIAVDVHPAELVEAGPGVVDVYAALDRQFFWADRVILNPGSVEPEVLVGEIVDSRPRPS